MEEAPDEDMDDEWKREIRHIPLQANIELKMPWIRHSYSEVSGVNEADFEEELSDEAKFIEEKGLKSEFENWKNDSKNEPEIDEKNEENSDSKSYDPDFNIF